MTEAQKYFFDLQGWILIPSVLSEDEIEPIKRHVYDGGTGFTGPAQELLDHPVVVDILSEILGTAPPDGDYYSFRCEGAFTTVRSAGWQPPGTEKPHGGRGTGPINFQCFRDRIYSGMTRVVWELNPIEVGDGGTLFLSGTHKANFPHPHEVLQPDNPHLETYSCPAGSLFIFTESLLHAGTTWKNPDRDRVAIFYAYNGLLAQFHRLNLEPAVIEEMPKKRQSLFRGVWAHDFSVQPHDEGRNRYYSPDNRSLGKATG
jgi:hypothetical protein